MERHIDQVSHCRIAKGAFDGLRRVIQAAVQGTEIDSVQSQWAFMKSPNRIDGVEDFKHRDFVGRIGQRKAAMQAPLSIDQLSSAQALHDFRQIPRGHSSRLRDGFIGFRLRLIGQVNHGS